MAEMNTRLRHTLLTVLLVAAGLTFFVILPGRAYGACFAIMLLAVAVQAVSRGIAAGVIASVLTSVLIFAGMMGHSGESRGVMAGTVVYLASGVALTLFVTRTLSRERRLLNAPGATDAEQGGGPPSPQPTSVEEELRRAHEQIRSILFSISDSFLALDREWRIQFANPRVMERLGRSWEQLRGQNVWDLAPTTLNAFYPGYNRVMQDRTPQAFETSWRGPDSVERHYHVNAFPTPDGMAALVTDITEQKLAMRHLEESRRQLRMVLDAADVGSWIVDCRTGELTDVGNTSRLSGAEALGSLDQFYESLHPDDRMMVEKAIATALKTGSYRAEYRVKLQDGKVRWLRAFGTVYFDLSGEPSRMAGVVFDVTERREADEVMRRTEKLAAAGRLAATIAHEINNPLEAVTNLLYLCGIAESAEERNRYLETAQHELARVSHITRQSLGFYRDSALPAEFRVIDALETLLELYDARIRNKQVRVEMMGSTQTVLFGRRGEFVQVLSNLLTNALDAVEQHGRIRVRWKTIGEQLSLSVADSGPGISESAREKMFTPFFTTKAESGTGLGLFVSRDLMQKQGGSLHVRSRTMPPTGTVFTLRMPLRLPPSAQD